MTFAGVTLHHLQKGVVLKRGIQAGTISNMHVSYFKICTILKQVSLRLTQRFDVEVIIQPWGTDADAV